MKSLYYEQDFGPKGVHNKRPSLYLTLSEYDLTKYILST